jgi:hypothetical protein
MRALTIWQPWASLIIEGCKPFEFRKWPAYEFAIGQRIVIHASARLPKAHEIAHLLNDPLRLIGSCGIGDDKMAAAHALVDREWNRKGALPLAVGLGTAILGKPFRCSDRVWEGVAQDFVSPDMWAWPMLEIDRWAAPIPMKGAQGFWNWPTHAASEAVRGALL